MRSATGEWVTYDLEGRAPGEVTLWLVARAGDAPLEREEAHAAIATKTGRNYPAAAFRFLIE